MRRIGVLAAVVGCMAILISTALAEPKRPRPPLGTNPHPVIWGGMKPRPPAPPPHKPHPPRPDRPHHPGHKHRPRHCPPCYFPWNVYYPYGDYGWYYGPWPQPMGFFPPPQPPLPPQDDGDDEPPPQRATGAQSIALGWKFIGYGDARFAKGDFAGAAERYATATRNAPQLADAWMRRGFALAAVGNYDAAVRHMRRALQLNPKWPSAAGDLQPLFAQDAQAKTAHLEDLLTDATDQPLNANVQFVVGVHLYCDRQRAAAEQLFRQALNVAGPEADHIRAFLGR